MNHLQNSFQHLVDIMLELRQKCPWDKKQTIESLRYLTLEETYELSDAIIMNDMSGFKEELGDLMLHIIFYSILAEEKNQFNLNDVLQAQTKKLIHRHPHIYSDVKVSDVKDVKKNWELLKLKEKEKKSILSGVPKSLPAMLKTYRILEKVRGVGFDFTNNEKSFDKIVEEIHELKEELLNNDIKKIESELGDLIFSIIGFAQKIGVNSIDALEKTNAKFIARFQKMEEQIILSNKSITNYSIDELDILWNKAKIKK
ncbi:MAG: nucleoside triphosphate pyrophosphohydrolase [Flavobacteriales bacterium]|nr:nucleoside triphosphate pyrophosphohydrolase [Flavobacteriales bacterium]